MTMKLLYERPDTEVLSLVQEEAYLQSREDGSNEPVGYDDDPFAGGGN